MVTLSYPFEDIYEIQNCQFDQESRIAIHQIDPRIYNMVKCIFKSDPAQRLSLTKVIEQVKEILANPNAPIERIDADFEYQHDVRQNLYYSNVKLQNKEIIITPNKNGSSSKNG